MPPSPTKKSPAPSRGASPTKSAHTMASPNHSPTRENKAKDRMKAHEEKQKQADALLCTVYEQEGLACRKGDERNRAIQLFTKVIEVESKNVITWHHI